MDLPWFLAIPGSVLPGQGNGKGADGQQLEEGMDRGDDHGPAVDAGPATTAIRVQAQDLAFAKMASPLLSP